MTTNMKRKWLFAFSTLLGVLLLGFGCYLLTPNPPALTINSYPAAASNEGPGTAAFATDAGKAEVSPVSGTPARRATESLAGAEPSQDFSGVTTIDPTLSSTIPTSQKTPEQKTESTSPLPLVFQPIDPHAFKLTPDQEEILERLQQNFLDEIGGADRDPNDPEYLARWKKARSLVDDQLQAQLGQDFFQRYQIAAAQQAAKKK
jgi:hypothetical protein